MGTLCYLRLSPRHTTLVLTAAPHLVVTVGASTDADASWNLQARGVDRLGVTMNIYFVFGYDRMEHDGGSIN